MTSGRLLVHLIIVAALISGLGCRRTQRNDDFVPREEVARSALEAYLLAWSAGSKSPDVPDTNPPVSVVDELRLKGRALTGYKILGQVSAEAPVCFAVQLSLNNPPEERRERYVVVGIDPLWVWRYDEYVMITHWCQPMSGSQSPPLKP